MSNAIGFAFAIEIALNAKDAKDALCQEKSKFLRLLRLFFKKDHVPKLLTLWYYAFS